MSSINSNPGMARAGRKAFNDRPSLRRAHFSVDWIAVLLFAAGILRFVEFRSTGTLFGTDLAVLAGLPFAFSRTNKIGNYPESKRVLILSILWLLAAIITDIVMGTSFDDIARGWAKVAMFSATMFVLIVVSELKFHRIVFYMCGLAVAILLEIRFHPAPYQIGYPWKFGLGTSFSVLAAALASLIGRRAGWGWFRLLPLILVGILCLANNARSIFGTVALTVAAVLALRALGPLFRRIRKPWLVSVVIVVIGVPTVMGIVNTYGYLADSGILGIEAQQKYQAQTASGGNVLLGGRNEMLVSSRAIWESPIVGHGSWAKSTEYRAMLVSILRAQGVDAKIEHRTGEGIPSHSYFFQAWVEHGILGALFWIFCIILVLRSIPYVLRSERGEAPIFFFAIFTLLWSILFSPFGADDRFYAAGEICMALWSMREAASKAVSARVLSSATAGRSISVGAA